MYVYLYTLYSAKKFFEVISVSILFLSKIKTLPITNFTYEIANNNKYVLFLILITLKQYLLLERKY